jgi:hypothetical protein
MSKMFDAFIQQTYGSYSNAQKADEQAAIREQKEQEIKKGYHSLAVQEMLKDQSIKSALSIPSKIKDGELNQKPEVHENFKSYKHDLELDRAAIVRAKFLERKYENNPENMPSEINFKELETGDVSDMFNNIFDDK